MERLPIGDNAPGWPRHIANIKDSPNIEARFVISQNAHIVELVGIGFAIPSSPKIKTYMDDKEIK